MYKVIHITDMCFKKVDSIDNYFIIIINAINNVIINVIIMINYVLLSQISVKHVQTEISSIYVTAQSKLSFSCFTFDLN